MSEIEVLSARDGTRIGRIWSEGDSTLRSEPETLILLTRRFLVTGGKRGAPRADSVLAAMDGWSNGYLTIRLTR